MSSTSSTFRSLRIRNYRLYWGGAIVSNVGTWMQRIAQDWLVLSLSHSGSGGAVASGVTGGASIGITTGLQFLPLLLFGLWGGVLADRYPKRRLLMCTQVSFGLVSAAIGALVVSGHVEVWHVYVLALLFGCVTALDNPTRQSFAPELVGSRDVGNAVALNSASFNTARLLGPAVAGGLIHVAGTGPVFFINAVSYIGVLIGLKLMRPSELRPAARATRERGQLRAGLSYVAARPELLLPMIVVGFVGTFGFNFQLITALMAKEVFHRGAGAFGLLGSAVAVGSVCGALLAARRTRPRQRFLVEMAVLFSVLEIASAFMPSYLSFGLILVPIGLASNGMASTANASIQLASAPSIRGRVMSLYVLVFVGGTAIGAPTIGWLAGRFGAQWGLIAGGILSLVPTLIATRVLTRRRGLTLQPHIRPLPHWELSSHPDGPVEQQRAPVTAAAAPDEPARTPSDGR
ncbi:MAG: MFS transporter [Streptosporangiales bacterium]